MSSKVTAALLPLLLILAAAGCASPPPGGKTFGTAPSPAPKSTVAHLALGNDAIPIGPGEQIRIPGIFRVAESGAFYEICANDLREAAALKAIQVETTANTGSLEDELDGIAWSFTIPGIAKLAKPYEKVKVDGYTIRATVSPSAESVADHILANVGEECRDRVLPRNYPYIVVTAVAVADKLYTLRRGLVDSDGGLGPLEWDIGNPETTSPVRTAVTFAALGRVVTGPTAP